MPRRQRDLQAHPIDVSPVVVGLGGVLAGVAALVATAGIQGMPGVLVTVVTDLPVAAGIFVAAAGWGWLVFGKLVPTGAPAGLKAVTCVATGLWLLGTALLAVGSLTTGCLTGTVWWPALAAGWALVVFAVRKRLRGAIRLPTRAPASSLLWVLPAVAVGLWLAGATLPPGLVGRVTGDFYDVVSYHLQVPREYYEAGHIGFLGHNTYSNYPSGCEMLFLLAMCLKGGAYAGMYAAKLSHGLWAVLGVAGVYCAAGDRGTPGRRIAAVLLGTVPMGICLGWLAFVEWSQLAYLAVALAYLRRWLADHEWRAAALVGVALGGACATKYLSVGLLVGPVVVVVAAACATRPARITHALIALTFCAALFAPWLIRNAVNTGDPVFPLATGVFGRGPWDAAQAARWDTAHAPKPWTGKPAAFVHAMTDSRAFGLPLVLLTACGVGWTLIRWRRCGATARLCAAVIVLQVAVWALATHMPGRFLIPAAVPMAMLAGVLADAAIGAARSVRGAASALATATAAILVAAAAGAGLWGAWAQYRAEPPFARLPDGRPAPMQGVFPETLWKLDPAYKTVFPLLADGGRLLQVGDVRPFSFPSGTVYATVWERDPLARIAEQTRDPVEIMRRLRSEYGITHLWISWSEIARLRRTYGRGEAVNEQLIDSLIAAGARRIPLPGPTPLVDTAADRIGPRADNKPALRPILEVLALPDETP